MGVYETAVCDVCGSEARFESNFHNRISAPEGWSSGRIAGVSSWLYDIGAIEGTDAMVCSPQCASQIIGSVITAAKLMFETKLEDMD